MKLSDMNLVVITIGSKIHANCWPNKAKKTIAPSTKNLALRKFLLAESLCAGFLLPSPPVKSIIAPKGQAQPQKNLPNIKVRMSIIIENAMPGRIIRAIIEVTNPIKGSVLRNISVGRGVLYEYRNR